MRSVETPGALEGLCAVDAAVRSRHSGQPLEEASGDLDRAAFPDASRFVVDANRGM